MGRGVDQKGVGERLALGLPPSSHKKNMVVEPDFLLLKHGCWARLFTRLKKDVAVEPDIFVFFILQTWLLGQALHKTQTTFGC